MSENLIQIKRIFEKKTHHLFRKIQKSNCRLCFGASKSHDASAHEALNKSGRSKKYQNYYSQETVNDQGIHF